MIDLDGSGGLDKEELATVMRSLGQKPSDEELDEMLEQDNPDGDGELDFSEFLKLMTAPNSRGARRLLAQIQEFRVSYTVFTGGLPGARTAGGEETEITVSMIREVQGIFGDWCGNCGYSRICDCGEDPYVYTPEEMLQAVDADGGGTVGFVEFCQLMTDPTEEWRGFKNQIRRLREDMILVDVDGSGGVTPDEYLWLIPPSCRPTVAEIPAFYRALGIEPMRGDWEGLEISFRDFCLLICDKQDDYAGAFSSKHKQSLGQLMRSNLTDIRKSFELIDKSKDGYVEPDEMNTILKFFDLEQDEAVLKEQVVKMGKFGTNTVSLADFAADLVNEVHLETAVEAKKGFHDEEKMQARSAFYIYLSIYLSVCPPLLNPALFSYPPRPSLQTLGY